MFLVMSGGVRKPHHRCQFKEAFLVGWVERVIPDHQWSKDDRGFVHTTGVAKIRSETQHSRVKVPRLCAYKVGFRYVFYSA